MAVAKIEKTIRRSVAELPEGELTVALTPDNGSFDGPTLELKIKGAPAKDAIVLPLKWLFEKSLAERQNPPDPEAPIEPERNVGTEFEDQPLFREFFRKLHVATYGEDGVDPNRIQYLAMVTATRLAREILNRPGELPIKE